MNHRHLEISAQGPPAAGSTRWALCVVGLGLAFAALRALATWHGTHLAPTIVLMNWKDDLAWNCTLALLLPFPVLWARREAHSWRASSWLRGLAGFALLTALHRLLLTLASDLFSLVPAFPFGSGDGLRPWIGLMAANSYAVGTAAAVAFLFESERLAVARQHETLTLRAELRVERARLLRQRLDPHFLFNALNAAASLLPSRHEQAGRVISRLRELLLVSASEQEDLLPLERELGIADTYFQIERERFGERLEIAYEVETDLLGVAVPPLLLQPLVENAIHHGLARPGGGHVVVRARRSGDKLTLEIEDDGEGRPSAPRRGRRVRRNRGGLGLAATRARLAMLFGGDHSFEIIFRPGQGTLVRVSFPIVEPT